ncbi:MAG: hypothetical protein E7559_10550 [Ruminococcaceae bacterium]|nr:hypothetical protein [Oscillospiraceae bacterium]
MKIIILHAGKTGTTEKCAGLLAAELCKNENVECEVYPVLRAPASLSGYDAIVLGSAVRMGMFHKDMSSFIKNNAAMLLRSPAAYYCCCGFPDRAEEFFEAGLGHALRSHALAAACFGGEMDLSKQKGFEKLIVRMVGTQFKDKPAPAIDEAAIAQFAEKLYEKVSL